MSVLQSRQAVRFRRGASGAVVAIVVVAIIVVGGIYAYNSGYLPISPSGSSTPASSFNNQGTQTTTSHVGGYSATPVDNIYNAYTSNAASAGLQYGGKTILVDGEIGNVEQDQNGNYESCVMASSTGVLVTGCQITSIEGGFVIWTWANQQAAAKVPLDTLVVAQCTVSGLQNDNLVLTGCTFYDAPLLDQQQQQQQQQQAFCQSVTGGITITNLVAYAPSGGVRYGHNNNVNISMTVQNAGTQPVATLGGSVLVYSNLPSVQVGALNNVIVNASSQETLKFVIAQDVSANAILAGTTLHLTFDFGVGQRDAGGIAISGSCPVTVTTTTIPNTAATTSTTSTLAPTLEIGLVQLSSSDFGPSNSNHTFTCYHGSPTTPPWFSMLAMGLNFLPPGGYPSVNITSVTIISAGFTYSYTPAGTCGIQPNNQVLGVWLLFSHQYFPSSASQGGQYEVTVNLSNGSQLQTNGSFQA